MRHKRKVAEIKLDQHHFLDRRGKWIMDFKPHNALASDWQLELLLSFGCKREALNGIRFHIANQMIAKYKRNGVSRPQGSQEPTTVENCSEATQSQEQKTLQA